MPDEPVELNKEEVIIDEDDWENRVLWIDESCIGVVGPDGRCKECGKPYKESPSADFAAMKAVLVLSDLMAVAKNAANPMRDKLR